MSLFGEEFPLEASLPPGEWLRLLNNLYILETNPRMMIEKKIKKNPSPSPPGGDPEKKNHIYIEECGCDGGFEIRLSNYKSSVRGAVCFFFSKHCSKP